MGVGSSSSSSVFVNTQNNYEYYFYHDHSSLHYGYRPKNPVSGDFVSVDTGYTSTLFDVWYDGVKYGHLAYTRAAVAAEPLYYRHFEFESNGTLTFSNSSTISASSTYLSVNICTSEKGLPVIAYSTNVASPRPIYVDVASNFLSGWVSAPSYPIQVLGGGNTIAKYSLALAPKVSPSTSDGSGDDTVYFSWLIAIAAGNYDLYFRTFTLTDTGSDALIEDSVNAGQYRYFFDMVADPVTYDVHIAIANNTIPYHALHVWRDNASGNWTTDTHQEMAQPRISIVYERGSQEIRFFEFGTTFYTWSFNGTGYSARTSWSTPSSSPLIEAHAFPTSYFDWGNRILVGFVTQPVVDEYSRYNSMNTTEYSPPPSNTNPTTTSASFTDLHDGRFIFTGLESPYNLELVGSDADGGSTISSHEFALEIEGGYWINGTFTTSSAIITAGEDYAEIVDSSYSTVSQTQTANIKIMFYGNSPLDPFLDCWYRINDTSSGTSGWVEYTNLAEMILYDPDGGGGNGGWSTPSTLPVSGATEEEAGAEESVVPPQEYLIQIPNPLNPDQPINLIPIPWKWTQAQKLAVIWILLILILITIGYVLQQSQKRKAQKKKAKRDVTIKI